MKRDGCQTKISDFSHNMFGVYVRNAVFVRPLLRVCIRAAAVHKGDYVCIKEDSFKTMYIVL